MATSHRARRGAAAIEFALVLPILVSLLLGIVEFSWVFIEQASVVASVREGARLGVTYATTDTPTPAAAATARVRTALNQAGLDGAAATVSTSYSGTAPSQTLTVTAVVPYEPLVGFFAVPSALSGSMTMLLEDQ
jgi:Flp pilus assembly protein TadG